MAGKLCFFLHAFATTCKSMPTAVIHLKIYAKNKLSYLFNDLCKNKQKINLNLCKK